MSGARARSEWASSLAFMSVMWEATGRSWAGERHDLTYISGLSLPIVDGDCSHEIKRRMLLGRKAMTNLDSIIKSRDITLPTNVRLVKAMVFSSSHVSIWELDYKESWALKNWCFWTVVLEKTLENPLDCKEIKPVNPKGKQSWIFPSLDSRIIFDFSDVSFFLCFGACCLRKIVKG